MPRALSLSSWTSGEGVRSKRVNEEEVYPTVRVCDPESEVEKLPPSWKACAEVTPLVDQVTVVEQVEAPVVMVQLGALMVPVAPVPAAAAWLAEHVGLTEPPLVPEQVQDTELPAAGNAVELGEPDEHCVYEP